MNPPKTKGIVTFYSQDNTYRTMTEWELDNRHAPDYVLRLLEYYIRNEGLMVKEMSEGGSDSEKEAT